MLNVVALSAFHDNYIWLIYNDATHECAVVDPGDAIPVLEWLHKNPTFSLSYILITHHHNDHTGGVNILKQKTQAIVFGPELECTGLADYSLKEGCSFNCLGYTWQAIHTPGHTRGHIVFINNETQPPMLFSGDTLFSAGCGRLFEGSAEQMLLSLKKIKKLNQDTLIYPAHEYTLCNLKFALVVEPSNHNIVESQRAAEQKCLRGEPTLPSTLRHELAINPFLRTEHPSIQYALENHTKHRLTDEIERFAALRAWKNTF